MQELLPSKDMLHLCSPQGGPLVQLVVHAGLAVCLLETTGPTVTEAQEFLKLPAAVKFQCNSIRLQQLANAALTQSAVALQASLEQLAARSTRSSLLWADAILAYRS